MRELIFRFWYKDNKTMVYPGITCANTCRGNTEDSEHVIMQYVGRKDIEGKNIFEFDIVESAYRGIGLVVFTDCQYIIRMPDDKWQYAGRLIKPKIIGNLYETPELIPLNPHECHPSDLVRLTPISACCSVPMVELVKGWKCLKCNKYYDEVSHDV